MTYNVCTLILWFAPPRKPRESKVSASAFGSRTGTGKLFDRAADANRETLTQFLVAGGRERAERLLADRTRFQLSPAAWDELVAIMDREARPNPKLAKLFSRRSAE